MDIALECRHQAVQCAEWLESLAGDDARVRVVTSSGSLTVSSKLLQLFSPLVRSAISSLPPEAAQEPVIVIPNSRVSTVRHFMNILSKGQIDYSELIFIPTADQKRKFCDVMKKNIVNLAKCLQVNITNFSMNSRHPLKNTIDHKIRQLKVRQMKELLRPEVILEKSEAEGCKARKLEAWSKPNSIGKFPAFNFNVNNNRCIVYETCPRDAKRKSPTQNKEKEAADSVFRWCQLTVEVGETPCAICKSKLHSHKTCPHKHEERYGCNPFGAKVGGRVMKGVMIKCAVCYSYSHMVDTCPHSERNGRNPRSSNGYWKMQCLHCESYDHLENCKEVDSERLGRNPRDSHGLKYRCNQCGSYNHLPEKCVHTLAALARSRRRCLYCSSYNHRNEADCMAENHMVRDYLRTRARVREQQRSYCK